MEALMRGFVDFATTVLGVVIVIYVIVFIIWLFGGE